MKIVQLIGVMLIGVNGGVVDDEIIGGYFDKLRTFLYEPSVRDSDGDNHLSYEKCAAAASEVFDCMQFYAQGSAGQVYKLYKNGQVLPVVMKMTNLSDPTQYQSSPEADIGMLLTKNFGSDGGFMRTLDHFRCSGRLVRLLYLRSDCQRPNDPESIRHHRKLYETEQRLSLYEQESGDELYEVDFQSALTREDAFYYRDLEPGYKVRRQFLENKLAEIRPKQRDVLKQQFIIMEDVGGSSLMAHIGQMVDRTLAAEPGPEQKRLTRETVELIRSSMFQVFHALDQAHKLIGFSHFDLHVFNIRTQYCEADINLKMSYSYFSGWQYATIKSRSRIKILDFGMSGAKYNNKVIVDEMYRPMMDIPAYKSQAVAFNVRMFANSIMAILSSNGLTHFGHQEVDYAIKDGVCVYTDLEGKPVADGNALSFLTLWELYDPKSAQQFGNMLHNIMPYIYPSRVSTYSAIDLVKSTAPIFLPGVMKSIPDYLLSQLTDNGFRDADVESEKLYKELNAEILGRYAILPAYIRNQLQFRYQFEQEIQKAKKKPKYRTDNFGLSVQDYACSSLFVLSKEEKKWFKSSEIFASVSRYIGNSLPANAEMGVQGVDELRLQEAWLCEIQRRMRSFRNYLGVLDASLSSYGDLLQESFFAKYLL